MHTCAKCGTTKDKPERRLPKGWKRRGDDEHCNDCWRASYVLRAIAIPVSSPVEAGWQEFRAALRAMWAATTQASNWMLTELYARDVRRTDEHNMPPMAPVYLYPETRARFPALPSQTCAALEQAVQRKYRAARYEVIWTCAAALPTYRYPTPFPVPNQGWSVEIDEERIVVSVRIGDRRWCLRLRGGAGFRRHRRSVEQIIAGDAIQGELALYEKGRDVMCKLVAWLPRSEAKGARTGALAVRTHTENLMVAVNEKDERVWVYHGDQVRRWVAQHHAQLQRWADDSKSEQRPVPSFAERRTNAVRKQRDRMASLCHQLASMVAGYASRRHFAAVRYDDTEHGFCELFPWFRLRLCLQEKLDAAGIELEIGSASADVETKVAEPLEEK